MKLCYIIITVNFVIISATITHAIPSCTFPPCRYNINRQPEDITSITVRDNSTHLIDWQWDVQGGRWNVSYKYTYPGGGWYEGMAVFINCSAFMNDKEQAFVSWGYAKNWESNAVPVYANAWNISYNGDIFGFVPTGHGHYLFRIYTKNRRHNPFATEDIILDPSLCSLATSDVSLMQKWWTQRKSQRNCPEAVINYNWNGKNGRWRIVYKWIEASDKTVSDVFYKFNNNAQEYKLIHWEIDVPKKSVTYTTNPIKINDENAWSLTLNKAESWGFQPTVDGGQWIFRHFSRNLVFYPFLSIGGKMALY